VNVVKPAILPKRTLGSSDLEVSPIGLGVMQFSGAQGVFRFMFKDLAQAQMNAIVQQAIEGGINWFDTAEMYGRGRSERGLAQALRAAGVQSSEVIVATKWLPVLRTARNIPKTIDARLSNLDGYAIDLYMVHQPWSFSSHESEMNAMADLVEGGKVRSVGVSNFNAQAMARAQAALAKRGLPLAVNQVQISLLHRRIERNGVLQAARDLGVTLVAWGPLASGVLTGKFHKPGGLEDAPSGRRVRLANQLGRSRPVVAALEQIGRRHNASPATIALNWLVNYYGDTVVAIPGASRPEHAAESAMAMTFQLSDVEMAQLDRVSQPFR
jgi:aryl-alcohol dehydrogenase-like predicted oxidoreductase